ncbi:MAG: protein phosphatase CheZ [Candidatus Accumulibacter sp.]|jgi:chemotaxis protein CheZ|nr:protein phosphatase CheZ [Accumulibacter sp.]
MSDTTSSGDSADLEALFDSIAVSAAKPAPAPTTSPPPPFVEPTSSLMKQVQETDDLTEDSQDLQALFDTVASSDKSAQDVDETTDETADETAEKAVGETCASTDASAEWTAQNKVFTQVGQMARQLHDTLGALGYDKLLEKTVNEMPDARSRLKYIADLTEQAACKVLNATDAANPLQDELEAGAALLAAKWDNLYADQMGVEDFKLLASETRAFLKNAVPQRTSATKDQLLEIMMAQDFQDLTGQVIKKIVSLAQNLETQLMSILIETIPGERHVDESVESVKTLLNGPVINGEGRADVVVSQQQVDDLLDSLGF